MTKPGDVAFDREQYKASMTFDCSFVCKMCAQWRRHTKSETRVKYFYEVSASFAYKSKPQSIDTHALGTVRGNNGNVVVLAASFRLKQT